MLVFRTIFVVTGGITIRKLNLDGSDDGIFRVSSGQIKGLAVDPRTGKYV